LRKEDVTRIDTTVETAMRTIIGCGAGASLNFLKISNNVKYSVNMIFYIYNVENEYFLYYIIFNVT